jgi:hypothetical protein
VKTLYTDTDIKEYFRALTGFQPRQFSTETIHKILNRQDVLLRAPTGPGKAETAHAPFLFCVSGMDLLGGRFGNSLRGKFSIARMAKLFAISNHFGKRGCFFQYLPDRNSNHSRTPVAAEFEP